MYGTTYEGGADGDGTVFSITTSGVETVLHSFDETDGRNPTAGLIDVSGTLYGTTRNGGAGNGGAVFAVTTSGTETVLHSFGLTSADGNDPYAGLVDDVRHGNCAS